MVQNKWYIFQSSRTRQPIMQHHALLPISGGHQPALSHNRDQRLLSLLLASIPLEVDFFRFVIFSTSSKLFCVGTHVAQGTC